MTHSLPDMPSDQNSDEIDLGELLDILADNRQLIFIITFITCMIGAAISLLSLPIYKADSLLQVRENTQSMVEQLDSLSTFFETKTPVQAEIELIKSRMILGKTIRNLSLDIIATPRFFPFIGAAAARWFQRFHESGTLSNPPSEWLSHYAWGGEVIQVDTLEIPDNWKNEEIILQSLGENRFELIYQNKVILEGEVGKLAAKQPEGSLHPIKLFVTHLKARPNTHFTLIRRSQGEAIRQLKETLSIAEIGKGTGILQLTIESDNRAKAVQIVNEIANTYLQQNVEQKSAESQKTLEFLEKQLPALKEQLETTTNALNDYRIREGSINLDLETQNILTGTVELNTQITLLQQKRDELRQRFTESHPNVVAIDKQISRLQTQIHALDKKIGKLPETQQIILRLSRDVEVNAELYTTLLNHAQTIRVAKAGTVGNVRIVDYAIPPDLPIKPKKTLIMGIALMAGLMLGVIFAFIRRSLSRGVENPDIIEKSLNIPVYATVQRSRHQKLIEKKLKGKPVAGNHPPIILALENREDLAIESLRSLRTTLHFAFLEARNNILMITGPSPEAGKTFISMNLAAVMADAGKNILLIDGDLRRGDINKSMRTGREKGLSELISQSIDLKDATRSVPQANFHFIPTGAIPPNPSELLLHERFEQILETVNKQYDLIIIDSPPILAATDAAIIGRLASVTLMVVRAGTHPMRELEQSVKKLVLAGVNLKGVIFNGIPETSSHHRYTQYSYQYDYRSKK
ncbi:tyrosine-protein kinase Etk/Wzc [Nitrosomonas eutropha]|uniref:polysaccharide biosynthesis tyrosine autokinase n=2 Tax=Nitrosomonas TaxID=914 RepID=UPI000899068C|nr:polysaccharide biosynthesis tyrosine autokinase [Nitrosomonas eutropha]MXS80477.1 chain-length determining protein [Nitrosomonas sp. GH22]SDW53208.1 tyrosine-protein kinase Etk/Wzc [Nitrosomonas eutropha]